MGVAARRGGRGASGWILAAVEARFGAANALAAALEMRPLLAHCGFGLGVAHARAGVKDRARKEIEVALAEYRALDMPYWREQAERTLG